MHPFNVSDSLQSYGFWYTYWRIRNTYSISRFEVLWLIWIARNYSKHVDELLDHSV